MAFSTRRFIGKVSFERGLRRRVSKIGRTSSVDDPKKTAPPILPEEDIARLKRHAGQSSASRRRRLAIYNILKKNSDKRFSSLQVTAALASRYGFSKEKLTPVLNAANSLQRLLLKNGATNIASVFDNFLAVTKNGTLEKTFNIAAKSNQVFTNEYVVASTHLKKQDVSIALRVLEAAGLVVRLPQKNTAWRWISTEHRFSPQTLNDPSIGFKVLLALKKKSSMLTDLITTQKLHNRIVGSSSGIATAKSVKDKLNLLIKTKLVKESNGFFELTPLGKKLVEEQEGMSFLHPKLRALLVGEPRKKLSPVKRLTHSESKRLNSIQKYIEVLFYLKNAPRDKSHVRKGVLIILRNKYNLSHHQIAHIASLDFFPWSMLGRETLTTKILPALKQRNPKAAAWLLETIEKNSLAKVPKDPALRKELEIELLKKPVSKKPESLEKRIKTVSSQKYTVLQSAYRQARLDYLSAKGAYSEKSPVVSSARAKLNKATVALNGVRLAAIKIAK